MINKERAILLVEDNPDDAELTILALKDCRIANKVIHLKDGAQALEYLFADPPQPLPQLVLLDLKMPKVDGLEVLQRIRLNEKTRRLPVVILTSSREEEDIITSYNRGVNSYIVKPVDFEQFTQSVRQLGLYWMVLNVVPADLRSDE